MTFHFDHQLDDYDRTGEVGVSQSGASFNYRSGKSY